MANPSKRKGTRAETKVARYLTAHGLPTMRKALAGAADQGDLCMELPDGTEVTMEVKAGQQCANPSRSQMAVWKRQTIDESVNSGCQSALVIVRYKRTFCDAEVWLPNHQWKEDVGGLSGWTMMYIDDFAHDMSRR